MPQGYGPNYPLNYGFDYRASPLQPPVQSPGATLPPTTPNGQAASLDALRNALMSQSQMGRAGAIRGSMRMPTENKNLISTAYDLWRANNAEDKSIESAVEAKRLEGIGRGQAEQQALTAKQEQLLAKADAVYKYLLSQDVDPAQAKAAAQAVLTEALDAKEVLPKEVEKKTPTTQQLAESMGLKPGTPEYNQYVRDATISKSGTTYNIPSGYVPIDPANPAAGIKPIPGSKAEREMLASQEAEEAEETTARMEYGRVLDVVKQAKDLIGPFTTGIVGKVAAEIPGTTRKDLEGYIDTLQANLTFDNLKAMKAQSATGASGLGQVSEREGRLLAAKVASLDADQKPETLRSNLDAIERHYSNFLSMLDGELPEGYSEEAQAETVQVSSPEQAEKLAPGTRYVTPDGQEYVR